MDVTTVLCSIQLSYLFAVVQVVHLLYSATIIICNDYSQFALRIVEF